MGLFNKTEKTDEELKQEWLNKIKNSCNNDSKMRKIYKEMPVEYHNMPGFFSEAVTLNPSFFSFISDNEKTPEVCSSLIKRHPSYIDCVPIEMITPEFCLDVVSNTSDNHILVVIPEKYRTQEICQIAVKKDFENLKFVPDEFKTKDLCIIALNGAKEYDRIYNANWYEKTIENIPLKIKDEILKNEKTKKQTKTPEQKKSINKNNNKCNLGIGLCNECPDNFKKTCPREIGVNFHTLDGELCSYFWKESKINEDCPFGKNCPCGKNIADCLKANKIEMEEFSNRFCNNVCELKDECTLFNKNTSSTTNTNDEVPDILGALGKVAKGNL